MSNLRNKLIAKQVRRERQKRITNRIFSFKFKPNSLREISFSFSFRCQVRDAGFPGSTLSKQYINQKNEEQSNGKLGNSKRTVATIINRQVVAHTTLSLKGSFDSHSLLSNIFFSPVETRKSTMNQKLLIKQFRR